MRDSSSVSQSVGRSVSQPASPRVFVSWGILTGIAKRPETIQFTIDIFEQGT